jgi:hypothetical protein
MRLRTDRRWRQVAILAGSAAVGLSCREAATLLVKQALTSPCVLGAGTSALEVTVVDHQGGVVADALVEVTDQSGRRQSAPTDREGRVSLTIGASGPYVAEVTRSGYQAVHVEGVAGSGSCAERSRVVLETAVQATE